jgi:glycosyltransferase involved in cell wall biosynthesis
VSRLLLLLPSVPTPLDSGAKIRNHGLLKLLAQDHEVDTLAFGPGDLSGLARRGVLVPPPRPRSGLRRATDTAGTELPDMAQRLWSRRFADAVRRMTCEEQYDAVQAEGIEMARYLWAVSPRRRIYDAHNAEFLLQRRLASAGSVLARVYSRLQWQRLLRFEGAVVRWSRLTLAVSNHDANQLAALVGDGACVRVVPNGIDTSAYGFTLPAPDAAANLLFLGRLDFRPNATALAWFVSEVLAGLPQTRLFAVGAAPPGWLVRAGQHDDRVVVTGYVSDERPYITRCAAMVLPLETGGGSRLKALIAMASGLPIVSTRLGMEGLEAEPGTHYVVAESAIEWLSTLKRLLGDIELRRRLALNARRLVETRYDWGAIQADVRAAYQR